MIPPHTSHYLREIASCGYTIHLAQTGADPDTELPPDLIDLHLIRHFRLNRGLDFGAWQDLIAKGCTRDASEILLANDSVFGPFTPLRPIVEAMRARQYDAWGMVESQAITRHFQSWFIVMTPEILASAPVQRVMTLPFQEMSKDEIVLHAELGLGIALSQASPNLGASWASRRGLARLLAVNPMHTDWQTVLSSGQAPFLKTELLRDNPSGIAALAQWRRHIPPTSTFNPDWIESYLAENFPRRQVQSASFRARCVQALASENRAQALSALFLKKL